MRPAAFLLLLVLAGCEAVSVQEGERELPTETMQLAGGVEELRQVVAGLEAEREQLERELAMLEGDRRERVRRLRETVGEEGYAALVTAQPVEVELFFGDCDALVRARGEELARLMRLSAARRERLAIVAPAVVEGESWLHVAETYGAEPAEIEAVTLRLSSLLEAGQNTPDLSNREIGAELALAFAPDRERIERAAAEEEARRAAEAERAERLAEVEAAQRRERERREEERARREEAERVAQARQAEQEREARLREIDAAAAARRAEKEAEERAQRREEALRLYGAAVHRFHDGQYDEAAELLTRAVELEPEDARMQYYRGLAQHRLGRRETALADFQTGGEVERLAGSDGVGRALERIQGRERLLLEGFRP